MNKNVCKLIITLVCSFLATTSWGQKKININELSANNKIRIETNDGNDYIGEVMSKDSVSVRLMTKDLGEIRIQKINISKIEKIQEEQIKDGNFWYPNPNATRYLFAPSAFNLKKGEGYYQNTWMAFNQVSYGFTDNFTCGVGVIPFFLFGSAVGRYSPMWVTPKFTFGKEKKKVNFSAGAIAFFLPFAQADVRGSVGILYGTATFGNRDKNISTGLGWGFARSDGKGVIGKRPTLNISGMYRISKQSYLVSENWFASFGDDDFVGGIGAFSAAYRLATKNITLDVGLFAFVTSEFNGYVGYPWLGVLLPFGKSKVSKKRIS